jgi:hypothetical protein
MVQSAFVCQCGIGQVGDLTGERGPDGKLHPKSRAWDGKTFVYHKPDEKPVCPNLANHGNPAERATADRLAALESELAQLRGDRGPSAEQVNAGSAPGETADPFKV